MNRLCFAFVLLPALACSSTVEPGLTVTVTSLGMPQSSAAPEPRLWTTNLGYRVVVTTFEIAVSAVDLTSCPVVSWQERVRRQFEGTAEAHSVGSPTRSGVSVVESLIGAGANTSMPRLLASFAPPPGKYCGIVYHVDAADDDAEGSPTDGSMLGKSANVIGTFQSSDGGPAPFALSTAAAFDRALPFDAVELGTSRRDLAITVAHASDALFDDLDFQRAMPADLARELLAKVELGTSLAVAGQSP